MAVIALIGVLLVMFGQRVDRMDQAAAQSPIAVESVHPVTATPIPVAPAPRSATAATAPVIRPTAVPTPLAPVGESSVSPSSASTAELPQVIILDQTRQRPLVLQFRTALQGAGYEVAGVGLWHGKVPLTTVYYPVGDEAAAQALMAKFPGITRSLPVFDGVAQDKLTVIICKDFELS